MKKEELDNLLEKYYNGASTLEEENALRSFFAGNNIPEGYEAEKEIFSYYDEVSAVPEPSADFESRILKGIDDLESANKRTGVFRRILLPSLSVAAGLTIIFSTWFFITSRREVKDSFTDPKLAYAETVRILENVSSRLNQATRALEPVSKMTSVPARSFETISKTTGTVDKNLRNFDYFNKAIEMVSPPAEKK